MAKMLKQITAFLIVFIMSTTMITFADQKPITVFLDGRQLEFDVEPTLENGRTLVPMRVIFEALGAEVSWDNDTSTAIAAKDGLTIKITINDMKLYKNDEVIELDVPARLIDSRTLVPVRAVSEGMGANVDWNHDNWQVIITTDTVRKEPEKYDFDELSEVDIKKLDGMYDGIRYTFEQYALPMYIFSDDGVKNSVKKETSYLKEAVDSTWRNLVTQAILNIQMESESEYAVEEIASDEDFTNGYKKLIRSIGYTYQNFFSMGYENTSDGYNVFLITFKEAVPSMTLPCKYIGIALDNENKLRYFTAETDFMAQDKYFFREILEDGNIVSAGFIDMSKKSFLSAINNKLK